MDGHAGGGEDLERFSVEQGGNVADGALLITVEWGMAAGGWTERRYAQVYIGYWAYHSAVKAL